MLVSHSWSSSPWLSCPPALLWTSEGSTHSIHFSSPTTMTVRSAILGVTSNALPPPQQAPSQAAETQAAKVSQAHCGYRVSKDAAYSEALFTSSFSFDAQVRKGQKPRRICLSSNLSQCQGPLVFSSYQKSQPSVQAEAALPSVSTQSRSNKWQLERYTHCFTFSQFCA